MSVPLLVRAFRDPQQVQAFSLAEWNLVLRQAGSARLNASLWAMLDELSLLEKIPAPAREHLAWAAVRSARHLQGARWEVMQIAEALADSGVQLILLKGGAYTMAQLPSGQGRLYSDIDILVPKESLVQVESALLMHGWVSTHLDAYDQRYYRNWMHELPPMQNVRRNSSIDVHHAILPLSAKARPDPAKLRAAAMPVPGQNGLWMLAPHDMVLHSAVHLFYEGEFDQGLRDLIDIDRLLRHFGSVPGFWDGLVARAQELELARPLFYALRYAVRLLGTPVPPEVLGQAQAAGPSRPLLALMDQLFERALLPNHASCDDALTPIARFLLYIRANWLRMPPLLLARHLFHKAFISPKAKSTDAR